MSIISEFKEFAVKGNAIDLAIGVIIGGAFGTIVSSLVEDVIMPIVAFILGGKVDFSSLLFVLGDVPEGTTRSLEALKAAGVPVFAYGNFITILINFILLAFIIFMLVKGMNSLKRDEPVAEEAPAAPPAEEVLLTEIRDLLRKSA